MVTPALHRLSGTSPWRKVLTRLIESRLTRFPSADGTSPSNSFSCKSRIPRPTHCPSVLGICPVIELSETSNSYKLLRLPIDSGRGPLRPLLSLRLLFAAVKISRLSMSPIASGMLPSNTKKDNVLVHHYVIIKDQVLIIDSQLLSKFT